MGVPCPTKGSTQVQDYRVLEYDGAGRVKKIQYNLSPDWSGTLGSNRTYTYTYRSSDGLLTKLVTPPASYELSYGSLKRVNSMEITASGDTVLTKSYSYMPGAETNTTTTRVKTLKNQKPTSGNFSSYTYGYDALGNITSVSGSTTASYTYDALNQLTGAVQGGVTYSYSYNKAGNLTSKTHGGVTDTYTYGNSEWRDLLTKYNGHTISYDTIGNPTSYYDGTAFTWAHGRRLASAVNSSTGLNNTYTYDADGLQRGRPRKHRAKVD